MTNPEKPRLRFFEDAPGQEHILGKDRYLYAQDHPKFRAGIVGTGTIGQEHMRVAALLGRVDIHGIYDHNEHSMDVAEREFAKVSNSTLRRYPSLDALCRDDDIDVIFVCTPNFSHIDVLEGIKDCDKAIFVEKPMATTLKDGLRIVEIAAQRSRFVQLGLQYRYKAPYVEARHEVLERQVLGNVKTLAMSEYRPPFLDKVEQWNKFSVFSGGTLIEKCCHYFDLLNLFARAKPQRVIAVTGQAVNFHSFTHDGKPADIDDCSSVIIEYENGIQGSFTLNMFSPSFYEELVVCGDRGRLHATEAFDFQRENVARSRVEIELGENGASRSMNVGYTDIIDRSGHHGATFYEHIALVDQLEGNVVDAATPLQGLWSMVVAEAAQRSASSGEPQLIDDVLDSNQLSAVLR